MESAYVRLANSARKNVPAPTVAPLAPTLEAAAAAANAADEPEDWDDCLRGLGTELRLKII